MPTPLTGDKLLEFASTAVATKMRTKPMPVVGSTPYRFQTEWQADANSSGRRVSMRVEWYSDKATLLSTDTIFFKQADAVNTYELGQKVLTAPATARWMRITLDKGSVLFSVFFDRIEMNEVPRSFKVDLSAEQTTTGGGAYDRIDLDDEAFDHGDQWDAITNFDFTPARTGQYSFLGALTGRDLGSASPPKVTKVLVRLRTSSIIFALGEIADGLTSSLTGYISVGSVFLEAGDIVEMEGRIFNVNSDSFQRFASARLEGRFLGAS